jgi:hypothetical protein
LPGTTGDDDPTPDPIRHPLPVIPNVRVRLTSDCPDPACSVTFVAILSAPMAIAALNDWVAEHSHRPGTAPD